MVKKKQPAKKEIVGSVAGNSGSKTLEEALRESEERYRQIFEQDLAVKLLIEPGTGKILKANRAAASFYGYPIETLQQLLISDINKLDPAEIATEMQAALSEQLTHFVFPHRLASGEVRQVEVYSSPIDLSGQRVLYSIIHDITERKQVGDALRESEERLREVLENSIDAAYKRNLQTDTYDYLSPSFARISGYAPDEMNALPLETVENLMHPDDIAEVKSVIAESVTNLDNKPYQMEYRFKHKQGHYRWFQDRYTVMRDERGQPLALIGSVSDINERKRVEEVLRESEEKFRLLIDNSHNIIYTLTPEGVFTFVSPAWTTLLGHPVNQVAGKPFQPFVHPDDVPACMVWLQKVIETGQRQEGIEYRVRHIDGSWRWHTSSAVPLWDEAGMVIGFEGSARDITENKLAEEKLAESARKLAARNEGLRSALADRDVLLKEVHHRVKNNLMVISSLLNLQMRRTTDQEARESLRESDTRIMSMAMIHEQVLRSGEYTAIDSTSYINDLVSNIRNSLAPYNKDVRLAVAVQPGIIIGLNQAVSLGMIINEIVSNSFKHAFQDCEKPEISISCRSSEDRVQLSISDNGVGMPEGIGIDNPSSLGLELVNTLVKQMKGTIKYEIDEGSKFTIMFSTQPESTEEVK